MQPRIVVLAEKAAALRGAIRRWRHEQLRKEESTPADMARPAVWGKDKDNGTKGICFQMYVYVCFFQAK